MAAFSTTTIWHAACGSGRSASGGLYTLIKALHVAAIITWLGGMVLNGVMLSFAAGESVADQAKLMHRVRRWDLRVTAPAMVFAWLFGGSVMVLGGWFPDAWLMIKLVLVLVVSAIHGMQSGKIRRLAEPDQNAPIGSFLTVSATVMLVVAAVIAILAVAKPI